MRPQVVLQQAPKQVVEADVINTGNGVGKLEVHVPPAYLYVRPGTPEWVVEAENKARYESIRQRLTVNSDRPFQPDSRPFPGQSVSRASIVQPTGDFRGSSFNVGMSRSTH